MYLLCDGRVPTFDIFSDLTVTIEKEQIGWDGFRKGCNSGARPFLITLVTMVRARSLRLVSPTLRALEPSKQGSWDINSLRPQRAFLCLRFQKRRLFVDCKAYVAVN